MIDLSRIRRALISVSDTSGLVEFAKSLTQHDIELISTGGTARTLIEAGLTITPVEEVTGYPEMMDGRVKTLHPAIHGAVLARRDEPNHLQAMQQHGFVPIDLVCVNLYPFQETIRRTDVDANEAIEQIDIGGPALMRSAAKNHEYVTIVTSSHQYDRVANELRDNDGSTTLALRRELAAVAFQHTSRYDAVISAWMASAEADGIPTQLLLALQLRQELRYGENPHQCAALYTSTESSGSSVATARILHGKPLSYNNLHDAAAALQLIQDLDQLEPNSAAAAIIKHTNPCGVAVAASAAEAFEQAYEGDPLAAYGGVLAVSQTVDQAAAQRICDGQRFLEVIVAPGFDEQAQQALGARWKMVRLLAVGKLRPASGEQMDLKSIPGGILAQTRDRLVADPDQWTHAAGPAPSKAMLDYAAFLWTVTKHIKSNAIAIGKDRQLLGLGAGQVDRVTACRIAIEKAGDRITAQGVTIAASDAFFPFTDGPQLLIDAGVKCIVHPGGSKRDQETLDLCDQHHVTCLLTGIRHFRH
ncbi:MAG: bifunctional phosphoribosylaminoimidazolecarboxamide formyltransferase/IMP cyclohydrolase [Phycisphaerales bacterium]